MSRVTTALVLLVLTAASCGCRDSEPPRPSESHASARPSESSGTRMPVVLDTLSASQQQQKRVALAARDAMFEKLSGRLMSVIESDGPAQAISVCRTDAPAIGEQIEREFGVEIGRTSFKLRNSTNAGPEWVAPFVAAKVDEPTFVALPDDTLGALLPIRLKQKCTVCHGDRDSLRDDVRAALDLHYPNDRATGFREGDLRGWFWVEVPAGAAAAPADEVRTQTSSRRIPGVSAGRVFRTAARIRQEQEPAIRSRFRHRSDRLRK